MLCYICIPDDLSYNQPATQSYTDTRVGNIYAAGNAVDRNSTTCMRTQPIGLNSPEKSVWWKVDLGGVYNIYSINVLFKNYRDRSGIYLLIFVTHVSFDTGFTNISVSR